MTTPRPRSRLLAPIPADRRVRRFTQLGVGLVLYGATMAMMIRAVLGLDPWDVFHQGLTRVLPISFGTVVIGVSLLVLLLWIPLRQRPGVGTLANAVVVGVATDLTLAVLPAPSDLWLRIVLLIAGVVGNAAAGALYIGAGLGPGPRDGLMTGLVARTGGSVRVVRTIIEVVVLAIGWLLGGTVGIGTLAYALAIGPLLHVMLPRFRVRRGGGAAPSGAAAEPT